jgi:hypothetical protein
MTGIRTDPSAGDDGGVIPVSKVRNDLALPFITKKTANDYGATHGTTIYYRPGYRIKGYRETPLLP